MGPRYCDRIQWVSTSLSLGSRGVICVLMMDRTEVLESNSRLETLRAFGTLPPGKSLVRTSTVE